MSELSFTPEGHIYRLGDRVLVSVTQVLEDWQKIDFGAFAVYYNARTGMKIPADIWEAAQDRGTAVHDMLYLCLTGEGVDREGLSPVLVPYLDQIELFILRYKPKVLLAEYMGFDEKLGYAGRLDAVVQCAGIKRVVLFDCKSGMRGQVGPQTSAYEPLARRKLNYKGMMDRYVLDVKPKGFWFEPCGLAQDFEYFKYRLWSYKYERGNK